MKIVREEIDYKKQMENNNKNMKKSKETDTVIAVDPTYADAMEQDKKAEEKVGEIMKKKKEEQKSIETPDPSTGKPLKKNMYTKQAELDESLFDDGEGEEVEEEKNSTKLPEDVFTMVYDFIFDGLHKTPASIKGLEDVEDVVVGAEKYFQDVQNFTNIGVQIRNDEKDIAEYVKKIADALGFSTSEKRYERGVKNGDYVLFVEIPKDVAVMKASRFLGKNESLKEGNKCEDLETAVEDCFWEISSEGVKPSKSEVCNRVVDDCGADRKEVRAVVNKLWGKMTSDYNDDMVANGAETINHKPFDNESLKESRFPRFELEIWVPGSGGDDERERPLIESDDIGDILETIYNTKLDTDEAFLFTDVRRNFQLDQEYSREDMYNDLKDRLGDEFDFSDWDEDFEGIDGTMTMVDWKKDESLKEDYEDDVEIEETKDGFGNDIKIGDKVVQVSYRGDVYIGTVTKIVKDDGDKAFVSIQRLTSNGEVITTSNEFTFKFDTKYGYIFGYIGDLQPKFTNNKSRLSDAYAAFNYWSSDMYGQGGKKKFVSFDSDGNILNTELSEGMKDKKPVKESKKLTEDAKIYISLSDYRPWSGAVDTFDRIRKEDKMDELDAFIEEMYPDGLTDTELNDLLWFEPEYVFDSLGIDYEDEDEEDEDEDELELDFEEEDEEETDEE